MRQALAALLALSFTAGCAVRGGTRPGTTVEHLVLLKFKDETPQDKVEQIMAEFHQLPGRIPGIVRFRAGRDISTEGLAKGFTHGAVVTFRDRAARDVYLGHPEHEAFKKLALPAVAEVCVVDFEDR